MNVRPYGVAAVCALMISACSLSSAQNYSGAINFPEGPLNQLTEEEKENGWELLFDGETLDGWTQPEGEYAGSWEVQDGIIVSQDGPSHLFSEEEYKNYELQWDVCAYDVAVPKRRFGNSGVFVRANKTGGAFPEGYEVQVDPYDKNNPTGGIYGHAPGTLLVDEDGNWKPEAFKEVHEGKWIHQRVRIEYNSVQIWINGEKTLDWHDSENTFNDAGFIALQNHHPTDVELFTNIKIKDLD